MKRRAPLLLLVMVWACGGNDKGNAGSTDLRDDGKPKRPLTADSPELAAVNEVLKNHAEKLMATPGVVGVAIGLLDDDETPCLKILVAKKTAELEKRLPTTLDGHPVVVEESGVIRPLDDP